MDAASGLPTFTERSGHEKNSEVTSALAPHGYIQDFLNRDVAAKLGSGARVLDIGCGRGEGVAWLLGQGYDAYGTDVSPEYLERGRTYLATNGHDPNRLRVAVDDGRSYPFADQSFDAVVSNQVIEHVPDLDSFAEETARVSAPGAAGLHICPARWRPLEVHMRIPLVHWLPKGRTRAAAIGVGLRLGFAGSYFPDLALADRRDIFSEFSTQQTFYRPATEILRTFERHGTVADLTESSRRKLRWHGVPEPFAGAGARIYPHALSLVLHTVQLG